MAASPVGPAEPVGWVVDRLDDERDEQALDLVTGQWGQVGRPVTAGAFGGADEGEEGVGAGNQISPGSLSRTEACDRRAAESSPLTS